MKLKNTPWKVIEQPDQIVVVDSDDFDVATFDLEYLPSTRTVEEEMRKAAAIAALPQILDQLGNMLAAGNAEDLEGFDAAGRELIVIYRDISNSQPGANA